MTASSHIAGTYAPPAVQEPRTAATCRSPWAESTRLVAEDAPEVVPVGEDLALRAAGRRRRNRPGRGTARRLLKRDLLRAEVLLDRHREVGAALDRRVVGDDDDLAPADPADAGDDPGAAGCRRRTSPRPPAARARGTARRGIEHPLDPLPNRQLAARSLPIVRGRTAPGRGSGQPSLELLDCRRR